MKKFDILYARNSNGKINKWAIAAQDDGKVVIWEGLIDSDNITRTERKCKPKNIGKMNETTSYEQACSEAQSRWEKKKKQGYKSLSDLGLEEALRMGSINLNDNSSIERAINLILPQTRTDASNISKPMKAQQYFKDNGEVRLKFPVFAQPKLNGFRVMARWEKVMEGEGIFSQEVEKVVFRSKEGLRYDILEHIEKEFTKDMFFPTWNGKQIEISFDGEMCIHNEILSEVSSAVRKRNSKTKLLKFCIFDIAVDGYKQSIRIAELNDLMILNFNNIIEIVETITISSNEEAQVFTDKCINNGYEGAIFRDMKATYQFGKRPQTMTKLKRSQDKEFLIIDVVGGENSPDLGIFVCQAENGKTFKCTPEGSHDLKREYLVNKVNYIRKMLTVKFFERTKDNLPFHAVGITIRDYE